MVYTRDVICLVSSLLQRLDNVVFLLPPVHDRKMGLKMPARHTFICTHHCPSLLIDFNGKFHDACAF